jgi:hypothetical protein
LKRLVIYEPTTPKSRHPKHGLGQVKKSKRVTPTKKSPKEFLVAVLSLEQQIDLLIQMAKGHRDPKSAWFYHRMIDEHTVHGVSTVEDIFVLLEKSWKYGIFNEEDMRQDLYYAYYARVVAKGHPKTLMFMVMSGYLVRLIQRYRIYERVKLIESRGPTGLGRFYEWEYLEPEKVDLTSVINSDNRLEALKIYKDNIVNDYAELKRNAI